MTAGRQGPSALPAGSGQMAGRGALWSETLWLLAARWRIAVNGLRRGARWRRVTYGVAALALAFLGLVALGISYVFTIGIVEIVAPGARELGPEGAELLRQAQREADVIVVIILSAVLSLSVLVSFTVALGALYLSADLDMLLAAPVNRRAVFASKLLGGLLPSYAVVLIIAVVPLVGHGMAQGYDRTYYAAMALGLAVLPLLPTVVGALGVMLIVRHVSARRLGDVVGLTVVAMTLSMAVVAGSARQIQEVLTFRDLLAVFARFRKPYSPAEWLTRAIVGAAEHDWATALRWFGWVGALSIAGIVLLIFVSDHVYYEGWMRMQSADRRREMRRSRLPWNRVDRAATLGRPSGMFRWLSAPTVAVIRKDFRVIPRDLTNMAQVLSPLAVGVFFVLQRLLYPVRLDGFERVQGFLDPLLAMVSAGVAAGVAGMIMSRFSLTAFSIEGHAYWLLKSAPINRRELVTAKFLVAWVPFVGLSSALILLLEIVRAWSDARAGGSASPAAALQAFDPWLVLYACFAVSVVGAGMLAVNLALGAARPNLRWDSPHEMLTPDVGCLSLISYGAYGFVATVALLAPAATAGFPVIQNAGVLWALGLGLGLGLTALVVSSSLAVAYREIEAIGD